MSFKRALFTVLMITALGMAMSAATFSAASETAKVSTGPPAPTQTTVTLDAVADATIDAADPSARAGLSTSLRVYYGGESEEGRALIRFNLAAAVPSDAVIDDARLELDLQSFDNPDPVTLTAACLTEDWVESTVTWNTRPDAGDPTTTASVEAELGYVSLDVTDIVQAWHNVPHYGLVLSGPELPHSREFGSREDPVGPPRLVVTYHMPVLNLAAVADVTVDSETPSANLGDDPTLTVGWDSVGGEHAQRILLRFPTLELPPGAWVEEAWLELTPLDGDGGAVGRVTGPWAEDAVTWQSQPSYAPPLADPQPDEPGRWDVTELVNAWHLGLYPDYGLAVLETAGASGSATYSSSEGSDVPRLFVSYALGGADSEDLEPSPPPGLGPPTFVVDPELVPFSDALGPILVGEEEVPRPLAVLQAEQDTPFTFVADEVVYTPESQQALENFLKAYGGRVLRAPGLPEPPPGFEGETRDIQPDPSYLIQLDPPAANLDQMREDAAALGLQGETRLSSELGLDLLALVLSERNSGADIGLDAAGQAAAGPFFPSLTFEEEPLPHSSLFEDPINDDWRYPEMGDTTTQQTGVNRAWQYLAFANRVSGAVPVAIIDGGFCLDSSGGRCTDASGRVNIDLPASFHQYDFNGDDYNASGTNPLSCGGSPCPYHGSGTTSIATAAQNNRYGIAGVGSPVAQPMMFKFGGSTHQGARAILTAAKWGAKIASMSWTIDCNWWCRTFSGISGYGKFKDAMRYADAAGVLTVAAAGNHDRDLSGAFLMPCVLRWNSFCVGALANDSRARASFSNYGTKSATPLGTGGVNIWAPGESVRVGPDLAHVTNHDTSGTSLAAPFVAGAAALAWGVDPALTHTEVRNLILNTRNAPLNSTVAPGSVNVMRMAMAAGPPLQDRLGLIGHADAAALITDAGLTDLTITPGEADYFEYQAENYLASAQFTATYVEPLGDLVVGADKPSMMASQGKTTLPLATARTITSTDLCIGDQYGEQFVFYVKGANAAVGNAYRLTVQTTPATSLASDDNEPNDFEFQATEIAAPRMSSQDLFTVERIDCRNGFTLDTLGDTDFYSVTVDAADLSTAEHYTALCVDIHADFPLTATLMRDGSVLKTEYAEHPSLTYDGAQAGSYLLKVWGPTLNAYTLRTRVCDPEGNERAWDLENWLKNATLPEPPDLLPDPGGLRELPIWWRKYVWDPSTLFAMEANGVPPVDRDLAVSSLELTGSPLVFALGSPVGGQMHVSLGPGLGTSGAAHPAWAQSKGVYALLQDAEGTELWRVEAARDDVTIPAQMEAGKTYLLLVNGEAG
ncbi:MAG: DNRLRE domain-containing protein, partial [Chloroflexota bacterium]